MLPLSIRFVLNTQREMVGCVAHFLSLLENHSAASHDQLGIRIRISCIELNCPHGVSQIIAYVSDALRTQKRNRKSKKTFYEIVFKRNRIFYSPLECHESNRVCCCVCACLWQRLNDFGYFYSER